MVVTVAGVIAIAAVLTRHRLAPEVAAAVGLLTAIAVSASRLLPHWSSFSDAFPGGAVDPLSWTVVSIEIGGAIVLGRGRGCWPCCGQCSARPPATTSPARPGRPAPDRW
jgi:hypothetical protein